MTVNCLPLKVTVWPTIDVPSPPARSLATVATDQRDPTMGVVVRVGECLAGGRPLSLSISR